MKALLPLLLLLSPWAAAQDVILKQDKTEIEATVLEITDDEVKYRPLARPNGPMYTLRKKDVLLILYKDGSRDRFDAPPKPPTRATNPPRGDVDEAKAATATHSPTSETDAPPAVRKSTPSGWYYGLGYLGPTQGLGQLHGYWASNGYYKVLRSQRQGFSVDLSYLEFFPAYSPGYIVLTINGFMRFSESSPLHVGGGIGPAYTYVKVRGYNGRDRVADALDLGGQVFVNFKAFRIGLVFPNFSGGSLFTAGFTVNPFR